MGSNGQRSWSFVNWPYLAPIRYAEVAEVGPERPGQGGPLKRVFRTSLALLYSCVPGTRERGDAEQCEGWTLGLASAELPVSERVDVNPERGCKAPAGVAQGGGRRLASVALSVPPAKDALRARRAMARLAATNQRAESTPQSLVLRNHRHSRHLVRLATNTDDNAGPAYPLRSG